MESLVDELHIQWYKGSADEPSKRSLDDIWLDLNAALRALLSADQDVTPFLQDPPDESALKKLHTKLKRRVNVLAPGQARRRSIRQFRRVLQAELAVQRLAMGTPRRTLPDL